MGLKGCTLCLLTQQILNSFLCGDLAVRGEGGCPTQTNLYWVIRALFVTEEKCAHWLLRQRELKPGPRQPAGHSVSAGRCRGSPGLLVWAGLCSGLVMPVLPPCCEYLKTARVQGQGAQEHRLPGYKFATASVLLIPEAPLISLDLSFLLLWWG